jgi:hypothetical protein
MILTGKDARRFLEEAHRPSTEEERAYLEHCDREYVKYPFGD